MSSRAWRLSCLLLAVALVGCGPRGQPVADRAEPPAPPPPSSALAHGLDAMAAMDYEGALVLFQGLERETPHDPKLLHALASTHAALGHDVLAGAYLTAYLRAWELAPGREATLDEYDRHAAQARQDGRLMLALAAELALALPEEDRSELPLGAVTDKERIVAHVLREMVVAGDLEGAEHTATIYPVGATMAIAAGAATNYEAFGNQVATWSMQELAERVLQLEAQSGGARYVGENVHDSTCTNPKAAACLEAEYFRWVEVDGSRRVAANEAVLKMALATWTRHLGGYERAEYLYASGRRQFPVGQHSYLSGLQSARQAWLGNEIREGDGGFDARRTEGPTLARDYRRQDMHVVLARRSFTTGIPGEFLAFDDPLLVDRERFVAALADKPPREAIFALATGGRKLVTVLGQL